MEEFIKHTIEYQNWGLNAITFSFLGTAFFSLLQGWSLFKQNSTIRRKKSGKSLSVTLFIYSGCYFFSFFVYGVLSDSMGMMVNGLLGIPYIPILFALHKYKGFTKTNWIVLGMFSLMIPLVYILEGSVRDIFVLCGLFGLGIPLIGQIREMYKEKSVGAVEPRFIIVFMLASVFWFSYGLVIGNWIFVVFNPASIVILGIILALYYKYKVKTAVV